VDFSLLAKLFRELAEIAKKHKSKSWKALVKKAKELETCYLDGDDLLDALSIALDNYMQYDECPKDIIKFLTGKDESPEDIIELGELRVAYMNPFTGEMFSSQVGSQILQHMNDVIFIEVEKSEDSEDLSFQITTITEKGTSGFHRFMKSIPHLGKTVKVIRKRKTHSSRYTFRPYPLAVNLWLDDENSLPVPEDLRDFLNASIKYHSDEEWRTSIVLSAIAVESVLADLYEEEFKEYAPNVPLGELYHQVKTKINFPSDIAGAIEMVNKARISAVHRSRFPVSDREAINALIGSTTFIMWYSSNY
jgi:hypothetical protein